MEAFVQKAKNIADQLSAAAHPIFDSQLVLSILGGLGSEHDAFVNTVTSRLDPLPLDDFLGLLYNQEIILQSHTTESLIQSSLIVNVAVKSSAALNPPSNG
ncbi:hypothetical protein ACJRO7_023312 [Eucalyptus globulus]|uniref:Uncharacterized protein n=1 Tax=Eucalyptus globulus TaxID=34317 RepID=A0ABD3K1F2_EUCGL